VRRRARLVDEEEEERCSVDAREAKGFLCLQRIVLVDCNVDAVSVRV